MMYFGSIPNADTEPEFSVTPPIVLLPLAESEPPDTWPYAEHISTK